MIPIPSFMKSLAYDNLLYAVLAFSIPVLYILYISIQQHIKRPKQHCVEAICSQTDASSANQSADEMTNK